MKSNNRTNKNSSKTNKNTSKQPVGILISSSKEAVQLTYKMITDILNHSCKEETKQLALRTIIEATRVNATVTNCTFRIGKNV